MQNFIINDCFKIQTDPVGRTDEPAAKTIYPVWLYLKIRDFLPSKPKKNQQSGKNLRYSRSSYFAGQNINFFIRVMTVLNSL